MDRILLSILSDNEELLKIFYQQLLNGQTKFKVFTTIYTCVKCNIKTRQCLFRSLIPTMAWSSMLRASRISWLHYKVWNPLKWNFLMWLALFAWFSRHDFPLFECQRLHLVITLFHSRSVVIFFVWSVVVYFLQFSFRAPPWKLWQVSWRRNRLINLSLCNDRNWATTMQKIDTFEI